MDNPAFFLVVFAAAVIAGVAYAITHHVFDRLFNKATAVVGTTTAGATGPSIQVPPDSTIHILPASAPAVAVVPQTAPIVPQMAPIVTAPAPIVPEKPAIVPAARVLKFKPGTYPKAADKALGETEDSTTTNWAQSSGSDARTNEQRAADLGPHPEIYAGAFCTPNGKFTNDLSILTPAARDRLAREQASPLRICEDLYNVREDTDNPGTGCVIDGPIFVGGSKEQLQAWIDGPADRAPVGKAMLQALLPNALSQVDLDAARAAIVWADPSEYLEGV